MIGENSNSPAGEYACPARHTENKIYYTFMSQLLIQQKERRKRIRNRRILKFGVVLFLLSLVFLCLVFVSRLSRFRIETIGLSGQILVSPTEVISVTDDFLSGYYLGLFPRKNFLIYPNAALKKLLKEKFERIDTIQTQLVGFKKLEIIINERKQEALWCEDFSDQIPVATLASTVSATGTTEITDKNDTMESPSDLSQKCYFLDDNGLIFSEAPTFSGDAYFKYYGDIVGSPVGQTYLSTTTVFQSVTDFVEQIKKTSVVPVSVIASTSGDFTMQLSNGGKIYFNLSQSLSKSAENLKALLQNLVSSGNIDISKLDYIDLRFGDKLYYKIIK